MTFWGKGLLILENNDLQTAQEWNKAYIDLIALYVDPKNSNHLRWVKRHNGSYHSLGNKFFRNKITQGPPTPPLFYKVNRTAPKFFCVRQVWVCKILPTNLVMCKQAFIHHSWGTQYCEAFFLVSLHTLDRMQFFTILQGKLHSFNNQDDRSTHFLCAKN